SKRYTPWLRVAIAGRELTDAGSGRLFAGLSRPWMGLHTIDTVRRDAARRRIPFETSYSAETGTAEVTLDAGGVELIYTINMEKDVIERVEFADSNNGKSLGNLAFSYPEDVTGTDAYMPTTASQRAKMQDLHKASCWLIDLARPDGPSER
ncbi:MAG: hypothetical protein KAR47_00615, partial [Planctomycetes bacterium]|nr:hypothetical protein [Planctomycetota bacterium]